MTAFGDAWLADLGAAAADEVRARNPPRPGPCRRRGSGEPGGSAAGRGDWRSPRSSPGASPDNGVGYVDGIVRPVLVVVIVVVRGRIAIVRRGDPPPPFRTGTGRMILGLGAAASRAGRSRSALRCWPLAS